MPRRAFILAGDVALPEDRVRMVDLSRLEELRVIIHHDDGIAVAEGIQAIEALMALKPSALEGRRLRWAKRAWVAHNLVGHPLMQALAFLRLHRLAMRVHDGTVPRPLLAAE